MKEEYIYIFKTIVQKRAQKKTATFLIKAKLCTLKQVKIISGEEGGDGRDRDGLVLRVGKRGWGIGQSGRLRVGRGAWITPDRGAHEKEDMCHVVRVLRPSSHRRNGARARGSTSRPARSMRISLV